jgi:hypothetical protein
MGDLEKKFYLIPLDHREELLNMLPWLRATMTLSRGHEYTNYLFDLYKTYLSRGYTGTQTCGYCMQQVKHRMLRAALTFETYGLNPDNGEA